MSSLSVMRNVYIDRATEWVAAGWPLILCVCRVVQKLYYLRLMNSSYGVKLHLRHKRTKRQTDRRQESNWVHFSLQMWHLVAIILMIFFIIKVTLFHVFIEFLPFHLTFLCSIALRPPIGWTPLTDRPTADKQTDRQTDKQTNKRTSLCVS